MSDFPAYTTKPTPDYWVHDLNPMMIRFPEGWPIEGIHWYGMAYVMGFIVAGVLLHVYYKRGKSPLNPDQQSALMIVSVLGVLVGGRIGYILGYMLSKNPNILIENPLIIFQVNKGGMASHGGMIGVWIALGWYAWKYKIRFWKLMDITVSLAPAGVLFGRIANFINGELWGKETSVPWAVIFKTHDSFGQTLYLLPRHPSQIYAAAMEGLLLLVWTQWRFWKCKLPEGQLVGEAMVGYAIVRIIGEIFREPDEGISLILGLSRGQFYSVFLALIGIGVIWWARQAAKKMPLTPGIGS
ncbi:MAG: prolipoprotein diacylglyceryl transferase [Puniceicoccales bacterium]|jgi:phosphatidylglycerol:prolipoprotein diacylglycerol transferase|nr:prolipoprotein diacylglyceryl transferase [Puniceicoccales bacterium]